ncbi:MAG: DUF11 domain-containing protein [Deltaproteobacteria bacterium]|nr:DUF11 domain-containing protein [Deltaproteobacteria bacterium]
MRTRLKNLLALIVPALSRGNYAVSSVPSSVGNNPPLNNKKPSVLTTARLRIAVGLTVLATLLGMRAFVFADSVGQVQTTKYFTQDTIDMLVARAAAGTPGLQTGDSISYIIQFTPINNGSDIGVAGYITDYIPSGVEVIGASIVAKDGSGNFYDVAPGLPGGAYSGWGTRMPTYLAPFDTAAYDATGRCAGAGAPTTVTYAASGNWTVPAGVTSAAVEVWGGGGGGGGSTATNNSGGGGGGGGSYSSSTVAVTPGAVIPYVVGAAGAAGTVTTAGGVGGNSSFNGAVVTANGGAGGGILAGGNGAGGAGGAVGIGTTTFSGGSGANGKGAAVGYGGGGGGGAGSTSAGGAGLLGAGGAGGVTGGGAGGSGASATAGGAGTAPGGGGAGGHRTTASRAGGAGSVGRVQITYTAPLYSNNCRGRMSEIYADTGIFFSTDSRTSQYPAMPTRITQGVTTNGYNINPSGGAGLNTLLNQMSATTHNLWDAANTNAFGTAALTATVANANGVQGIISSTGTGATPYNAGSAVAGPQSGYQLDYTAQVGPWQRIYYNGSRMGDNTAGPATAAGVTGTVGGAYTSVGWNLSSSNPLPSGTNAVRWAVGNLTVGTMSYVKVTMRITGVPPSTGLINSSEVFGGDASTSGGRDSAWKYHVPSVADNNSNLYVLKTVKCVYDALGVCNSSSGVYIPAAAKIRYKVTYLNSGNANQTNVILSDTLPCQTGISPVSNITVISGSISATINPAAPAGGVCPGTRQTFSFNNGVGVTLLPAAGGSIEYDVLTNAVAGNTVTNTATLTSAAVNPGVTSNINSYVQSVANANLTISKTTSTPTRAAGETATYTITVTNVGSAATVTSLKVYDILPSMGGAANSLTRFNYVPLSSACTGSITCVNPNLAAVPPLTGTAVPPTLSNYTTLTNSEQVLWNFGVQTLAAGASFTITYNATVGASVSSSTTPYYNSAATTYDAYDTTFLATDRTDTTSTAGVTVTSPLSVTKTIESYYDAATLSWVPYSNNIPVNALLRYKIDYSNAGATPINTVNISDTLPCQIGGAGMVSNVNIVSGPITAPVPNPPATVLTTCPTTQAFSFTAAPTLNAGQTGQIKFDAQTNAALGNTVTNSATLSGTGASSVTSTASASVTTAPILGITKTASVIGVAQGGTLSYTITVANIGTAAATGIVLYDWLPSGGAVLNALTRFSYSSATSTTGMTAVVPTVAVAGTNLTGTVSVTSASTAVVGVGTLFLTELAVNDMFFINGVGYKVSVITNNLSLTLTSAYTGATTAGLIVTKTPTPYNTDVNAANMQQVSWNFGAQTLAPGASFSVVFVASVGASVPVSTAYYNNARVYYGTEQASAGAVGVAVGSNLSTSTKTWTDINGGDANPGDIIEYTIALKETAGIAVAGASVSDTLPATLTVPTVVTCPTGATCGFAGQVLTVTGISVTASGTTNIVIRGTIAAGTAAGTTIDNCATITNAGGTGAAPCATTITVSASTLPGFGNKPLYFYDATSVPAYKLSRAKPTVGAAVTINAGLFNTWTLSPALASGVTISNTISTTVPVQLYLTATLATNVTVGLYCGAALVTSLVQAVAVIATPTLFSFNLPLAAPSTCAAASSWAIRVTSSAGVLTVTPYVSATQISNVSLPSSNVIGVTSVTPYSTIYPGVTSPASYAGGSTVYVRAVVSDPFGSYDITSAAVTIKDPNNTTAVGSAAMTEVNDSLAATKTYEYTYVIPGSGPAGFWNATVTAKEGAENTITDTAIGTFYVTVSPSLTVLKSVQVSSDPVNGAANPKAIPGAEMLYTITVTNSGSGTVDGGTMVITDPIPANTSICVSILCSNPPVTWSCSAAPVCGLSYGYATDVTYSSAVGGGAPFTYTPVPDVAGYDALVTGVRINPTGTFAGASSAPYPNFSFYFKVKVK